MPTERKLGAQGRDGKEWVADLGGDNGEDAQAQAFQDLGRLLFARVRSRLPAFWLGKPRWLVLDESEWGEFAKDVVQDTLLQIHRCLRQYEGRARFVTWATRIAWHVLYDRSIVKLTEEALIELELDLPQEQRSDENVVLLSDMMHLVAQAANDDLTPAEREAFLLVDVRGLSVAEAAAQLAVPRNALDQRLWRARAKLRRELIESGYSADDLQQ